MEMRSDRDGVTLSVIGRVDGKLLNGEQAIVNRVQAQSARFADTAALYQALGGGWWNRRDVAALATLQLERQP